MSLESWQDEFVVGPPRDAAANGLLSALEHSLSKFIGLRPENLERHEVTQEGAVVEGEITGFCFNYENCAVCHIYAARDVHNPSCGTCLLAKFAGKCGQGRGKKKRKDAYTIAVMDNKPNPEPMIAAIEAAIAAVKAGRLQR